MFRLPQFPLYATLADKLGWWAVRALCVAVLVFLLAPILVMVPLSDGQLPEPSSAPAQLFDPSNCTDSFAVAEVGATVKAGAGVADVGTITPVWMRCTWTLRDCAVL